MTVAEALNILKTAQDVDADGVEIVVHYLSLCLIKHLMQDLGLADVELRSGLEKKIKNLQKELKRLQGKEG